MSRKADVGLIILMVAASVALWGTAEAQLAWPAPYVSQPSRVLNHLPQAGRERPIDHVGKARSMAARSRSYRAWIGNRRHSRVDMTGMAGMRPGF